MRRFRCLALLILSALAATACQKTIHEVRGPQPAGQQPDRAVAAQGPCRL